MSSLAVRLLANFHGKAPSSTTGVRILLLLGFTQSCQQFQSCQGDKIVVTALYQGVRWRRHLAGYTVVRPGFETDVFFGTFYLHLKPPGSPYHCRPSESQRCPLHNRCVTDVSCAANTMDDGHALATTHPPLLLANHLAVTTRHLRLPHLAVVLQIQSLPFKMPPLFPPLPSPLRSILWTSAIISNVSLRK